MHSFAIDSNRLRDRSGDSTGPAPNAPAYCGFHDDNNAGTYLLIARPNQGSRTKFATTNLRKRGLRHLRGITQDLHPATLFFSRCGVILVWAFLGGTPRVPAFTLDTFSGISLVFLWYFRSRRLIGDRPRPPAQSGQRVDERCGSTPLSALRPVQIQVATLERFLMIVVAYMIPSLEGRNGRQPCWKTAKKAWLIINGHSG